MAVNALVLLLVEQCVSIALATLSWRLRLPLVQQSVGVINHLVAIARGRAYLEVIAFSAHGMLLSR